MNTPVLDVEILNSEAPASEIAAAGGAGHSPSTSRCQYRYENGTQCRLRTLESVSGLCPRHSRERLAGILPSSPSDTEDLSAELLPELSEFDTATPINKYLERLLVLATKGRVTPRRAAVLAYLTNQLLHSVHAMDREDAAEPQGFIFDLPRPQRD